MWRLNDPRRTSSSVKADVLKYVVTYLFVGIIILLMKTHQFVFVRLQIGFCGCSEVISVVETIVCEHDHYCILWANNLTSYYLKKRFFLTKFDKSSGAR